MFGKIRPESGDPVLPEAKEGTEIVKNGVAKDVRVRCFREVHQGKSKIYTIGYGSSNSLVI